MFSRLPASAVPGLMSTLPWAANGATMIEANDAMQLNVGNVNVPGSCKAFTVTLTHTGKLARNVMGHDWVLTTAADKAVIDADGARAGSTATTSSPATSACSLPPR